jgi:hypothetical protein
MSNGFYRTTGMIAALVSMNIVVWIMDLSIHTDYLFGNHITESIMVMGILGILLDLNFKYLTKLYDGTFVNYLKLGVIALLFGAVLELFLFAGLMFPVTRFDILTTWFRIAPYTIFLIGLPVLWISDKMKYKKRLFELNTENGQGIIMNMILCFIWTFVMGSILIYFNY